jgi:peptidoglycan/LPS O-acetylase OafA/YrhL
LQKPPASRRFVNGVIVMHSTSLPAVTKNRYVTLDALRGVAAIIVVAFHSGRFLGVWVPRFGYLAVDLFFLLSGFVLAHSYERRFRLGMTTSKFLIARIVRLYPLYFLGLVLGTCVALLGMLNPDIPPLTPKDVAINVGLNLFGLPSPTEYAENQDFIFPLNVPFWSLFFEFWVANTVFGLFRNSLGWKPLLLLIAFSAVALIFSEKAFYRLDGGAGWISFLVGFSRVGFSFFGGVAIARLHAIRQPRFTLPSWLYIVVLPVLLSLPLEGRASHLYEVACVLIVFPAIIYTGASATERNPRLGAALGDASYAAYTIHFPLWLICSWTIAKLTLRPSWKLQLIFVVVVSGLAWVLNLLDVRVRASLVRFIKQP